MSSAIVITIRAEVSVKAGKPLTTGRRVTAREDEPETEVRNAVTLALREVNDDIREMLK